MKITPPACFVTSTEGRQRFPEIMQDVFGEKAITGFHRYGRALGAVIPLEAVRLLAGCAHAVDPAMRKRIRATARALLKEQEEQGLR